MLIPPLPPHAFMACKGTALPLPYVDVCVLSGRGLCVGLITRTEESYRVWGVQLSVIVKPR
jgi:hypothetical protein